MTARQLLPANTKHGQGSFFGTPDSYYISPARSPWSRCTAHTSTAVLTDQVETLGNHHSWLRPARASPVDSAGMPGTCPELDRRGSGQWLLTWPWPRPGARRWAREQGFEPPPHWPCCCLTPSTPPVTALPAICLAGLPGTLYFRRLPPRPGLLPTRRWSCVAAGRRKHG